MQQILEKSYPNLRWCIRANREISAKKTWTFSRKIQENVSAPQVETLREINSDNKLN